MATLSDLGNRAKALYESKLKAVLEPEQKGKFVAIEPDTESYFVADTGTKALLQARAVLPEKLFFLARIGYPTADAIGGYGARNRRG
jgi:hypothetical protein